MRTASLLSLPGKWKLLSSSGNTMTIETRDNNKADKATTLDVTFVDNNHIKVVQRPQAGDPPNTGPNEIYLKRL